MTKDQSTSKTYSRFDRYMILTLCGYIAYDMPAHVTTAIITAGLFLHHSVYVGDNLQELGSIVYQYILVPTDHETDLIMFCLKKISVLAALALINRSIVRRISENNDQMYDFQFIHTAVEI